MSGVSALLQPISLALKNKNKGFNLIEGSEVPVISNTEKENTELSIDLYLLTCFRVNCKHSRIIAPSYFHNTLIANL